MGNLAPSITSMYVRRWPLNKHSHPMDNLALSTTSTHECGRHGRQQHMWSYYKQSHSLLTTSTHEGVHLQLLACKGQDPFYASESHLRSSIQVASLPEVIAANPALWPQPQPFCLAHFNTSRCPPSAAFVQVVWFQEHPCPLAHFNTSR